MEDNPYTRLLETMRGEAKEQLPTSYRLGKVVNVNPLKVSTSGIILSGDDLLINGGIARRTEALSMSELSGNLTGTFHGDTGNLAVSGGSMSATAGIEGSLAEGDTVLLISLEDNQKFIVLCKVVSL
ncbi:hypothetical protein Dhaf_4810 [Desulfitobacterium hafniense DCB-2]|uniref:DUF2577 domain-containing protein n=1 Tax=Desulfitobacterium hafniense (strain DSM 10664 / DCB-2) TaxID=272564 RepID=B8FZ53_DESHD|nr:DUF2577 domain-containing protein [Desulfitobacterium hafniense]ACL22805.1 hypothetical protein Dhaf_4810 [Desulfitobacterium hafniense DCB-2]